MKRLDEEVVSASRSEPQILANYSFLIKESMDVTELSHFIHGSVKQHDAKNCLFSSKAWRSTNQSHKTYYNSLGSVPAWQHTRFPLSTGQPYKNRYKCSYIWKVLRLTTPTGDPDFSPSLFRQSSNLSQVPRWTLYKPFDFICIMSTKLSSRFI